MRLNFLGTLAGLLGLTLLAGAAAPPPPHRSARAADQIDCLFLASDHPVRIRLHVRVGDRPYGAAWTEFMDNLFAWFDTDGDGFLSATEASRILDSGSLQAQIQGSIGQNNRPVPLVAIDANKDGKVSKEEFRAYYGNSGFRALQFSHNNGQAAQAKQVNDVIFKRLDRDGDGKLSAAEVEGMYEKLRSLDENEDEILTEAELNTRSGGGYAYAPGGGVMALSMPAIEPGLVEVVPGQESTTINQIISRYDRNKDGRLSRAEIGLDRAVFDAFDRDRDGFWSAGELRAYLADEPDLVLRLQLGTPGTGKGILSRLGWAAALPAGPRLVIVNEKKVPSRLKKTLRRSAGETLSCELGDTRMSLQVSGFASGTRRTSGVKGFYQNQFSLLAGKKGYVEKADEKGAQPYLFQIFAQADKDGNGKLTQKELIAWLDLVVTGQECNVTLQSNDLGRGLFPILDANGDSRLSLREMKTVWSRMKPLARDGKALAQGDVPRTMRISVGVGSNTYFATVAVSLAGQMPARPTVRGAAPAWFYKMDRNGDGDVSPSEWLGTDEEFREIDRDGDGLISADEAAAFEAKKKARAAASPPPARPKVSANPP